MALGHQPAWISREGGKKANYDFAYDARARTSHMFNATHVQPMCSVTLICSCMFDV